MIAVNRLLPPGGLPALAASFVPGRGDGPTYFADWATGRAPAEFGQLGVIGG